MVRARRTAQVVFLVLFVVLVWQATFAEGDSASPWLRAFFDIDPLILIGTGLATHALPKVFLLGLITLFVTVLFGRVFCGWLCPLGTVHHGMTWLGQRIRRQRAHREGFEPGQRAKYYVLAGLLVMALFGGHWIGVFDPISLFYRTMATALYPGVQYSVEDASTALYKSDPAVGPLRVTAVSEPIYRTLRDKVFVRKRQAFLNGTAIFAFFIGIVLLNLYRRRFWCRYVCPLGGLLGTCSQRPVLRLEQNERCTNCGMCAKVCPAGADPEKKGHWRPTECYGCWNCVAECKRDALTFAVRSPLPRATEASLDVSKRAVLSAGVAGVGGLVLFRLTPQAQAKIYTPELIRPPGARMEREFLARCLKCGVCMKACPTSGLQPTGLEAGLEGIWTPRLVPQIGYCEYNCNACGSVCPTEAIRPLPLPEKQKVKMGLATFDTTRCLPYAYNRECMVCEEHCPLPTKAIFFFSTEVALRDGRRVTVKQPHVDPELCIGCGICENVCVFKDQPAIRVTSANETRHSKNQPIIPGGPGLPPPPAPPAGTAPAASADPYANPYK